MTAATIPIAKWADYNILHSGRTEDDILTTVYIVSFNALLMFFKLLHWYFKIYSYLCINQTANLIRFCPTKERNSNDTRGKD